MKQTRANRGKKSKKSWDTGNIHKTETFSVCLEGSKIEFILKGDQKLSGLTLVHFYSIFTLCLFVSQIAK